MSNYHSLHVDLFIVEMQRQGNSCGPRHRGYLLFIASDLGSILNFKLIFFYPYAWDLSSYLPFENIYFKWRMPISLLYGNF